MLIESWLFSTGLADRMARAMLGTSWLLVLGAFIIVSWFASRVAHRAQSLTSQYLALGGFVVAEAVAARSEVEAALRTSEEATEFMVGLFQASDPRQNPGVELTAGELLDRGVARVDELRDEPAVQARLLEAPDLAAVRSDGSSEAWRVVEQKLKDRVSEALATVQ